MVKRNETRQRVASISLSEEVHKIVEAWRAYFDEQRPGSKASTSEIFRAFAVKTGMPPSRPMPKRHGGG